MTQRVFLRFGSVNYIADVWLNGEKLGMHEGGHLPFQFEITSRIKLSNTLIVRVDGRLAPDQVPSSGGPYNFPSTNYDFFPFCGIHRPVLLYTTPINGIEDITVNTDLTINEGKVFVEIRRNSGGKVIIQLSLKGYGQEVVENIISNEEIINSTITVPNPKVWDISSPNLYDLSVNLLKNGYEYDTYSLKIGIRTIRVEGKKLLLNNKPIMLRGFGRHEDFPITGRGYLPAVIIKDYSIMKWIGANSFRTSHYPYSEQMMDLADRLGILVIDEIPAVGLNFEKNSKDRHLELCKQYIQELIARDKNHPSVIMWSLANEPLSSLDSEEFFRTLYEFTRKKDLNRLITLVNRQGVRNESFKFLDIVCLNRYYGWYADPGQIKKGITALSEELDKIYQKYQKPIILSEFGADTIPGWHAQPPEMFSEEYQVEFIKLYFNLLDSKDYIVGQHIWNLCDFKTSQGIRRMGGINYKGVFTRDRRPKMAAHKIREIWNSKKSD